MSSASYIGKDEKFQIKDVGSLSDMDNSVH